MFFSLVWPYLSPNVFLRFCTTISSFGAELFVNLNPAILCFQQEGSLCAQHCLNNLLQGEYFTPVDLSSIAHQLDEEERMRMAEGGMGSEEYRTFLQVCGDTQQMFSAVVVLF